LGRPTEAEGAALLPQIIPMPKAWGRTFGSEHFISSSFCSSLQLSPIGQRGWHSSPGEGRQHSRAEWRQSCSGCLSAFGRAACRDLLGYRRSVASGVPPCREAELTWLLRAHQSSKLLELKMCGFNAISLAAAKH